MTRATLHKRVIKLGFVCKKRRMKLKVCQRMDIDFRSKANSSAKVKRFKSFWMKLVAIPITPDSMFGKPVETTISLVILFGKEVLML